MYEAIDVVFMYLDAIETMLFIPFMTHIGCNNFLALFIILTETKIFLSLIKPLQDKFGPDSLKFQFFVASLIASSSEQS